MIDFIIEIHGEHSTHVYTNLESILQSNYCKIVNIKVPPEFITIEEDITKTQIVKTR